MSIESASSALCEAAPPARLHVAPQVATADELLEVRLREILAACHRPSLRHVQIEARQGTVTLRGQVRSFYDKQVCHECCRQLTAARRVIDSLEVVLPHRPRPNN